MNIVSTGTESDYLKIPNLLAKSNIPLSPKHMRKLDRIKSHLSAQTVTRTVSSCGNESREFIFGICYACDKALILKQHGLDLCIAVVYNAAQWTLINLDETFLKVYIKRKSIFFSYWKFNIVY